eukprot:g3699.t1
MKSSPPVAARAVEPELEAFEAGAAAPTKRKREKAAFDEASWLGLLSFSYAGRLLRLGHERALQAEDLDPLPRRDRIGDRAGALGSAWASVIEAHDAASPGGRRPSAWLLWQALYRTNRSEFWAAGAYCFGESFFCIVQPVLLGYMIKWLQEDAGTGTQAALGKGMTFAILIWLASLGQALVHHQLYMFTMRGGFNMRMAVTGLVHAKLLRLSGAALQAATAGSVLNVVSNDVQRFDQFTPAIHFLWSAPLDLVAIVTLVALEVGAAACFAGVSVVFLSVPLQAYFGRLFGRRRRITARLTDRRVSTAAEVFAGMLSVKALGWQSALAGRVSAERGAEHASILVSMSIKALNLALHFVTPAIATFTTFVVFWAQGGTLTLFVVFSTMSLLHALRLSFGKNWRRAMESGPEAHVAVQRIQRFLLLPERGSRPGRLDSIADDVLVELAGCAFRYGTAPGAAVFSGKPKAVKAPAATQLASVAEQEEARVFALSGLDFRVKKGELALVFGPVGCGKSSLLLALCGELEQCPGGGDDTARGKAHVGGAIAYSSQSAWIFAGTLRDNITFGLDLDAALFDRVVAACALQTDLEQLPAGADTEIGERGVNLSGGQRARVSLARAAYATLAGVCRVVLLDDPLAAVDVHVACHIFEHCVKGILLQSGETCVIMATHHRHLAARADVTVWLKDDGSMRKEDRRLEGEGGKQATEQQDTPQGEDDVGQETDDPPSEKGPHLHDEGGQERATGGKSIAKQASKLIVDEERASGRVTASTFLNYAREGGVLPALIVLVLFSAGQACVMLSDYWLKVWATSSDQRDTDLLLVYVALSAGTVVICLLRAFMFFAISMRASSALHNSAFAAVQAAPMSFFFSHPMGRILNKFSADQGEVDELLPVTLYDCMQCMFLVLGAVSLSCVAVPWLLIVLVPLVWVFMQVRAYYLAAALELKRLDQRSKSPIFAQFAASLAGVATIRAFGREAQSDAQFVSRLDANGRAWFAWLICNRWVGFRLDMLSTQMLGSICVFAVLLAWHHPGAVDAGLIGLSLVYAISLSGTFQYMVRQSAAVETMMSSVQRLLHYKTNIPPEHDPCYLLQGGEGAAGAGIAKRLQEPPTAPAAGWPAAGAIEVRDLCCRYRHDLPQVLRGIDMSIAGGAKVGIVGRTGSGKSSFINAMLRLNEMTGGSVVLDGVDTLSADLLALRGGVALIPQEPALFSGSMRFNLDPTGAYDDADLWSALRVAQLADFVRAKAGQLEMEVAEGGANLSIGQRQLLSLARAVLRCRHPGAQAGEGAAGSGPPRRAARIICMDECTANVDFDTDELIQQTLRRDETFAKCTLVIIAHRIKTVIDADMIVVLDEGRVLEVGPPGDLLNKADGAFAAMVSRDASTVPTPTARASNAKR